jgi:hypothetical protein
MSTRCLFDIVQHRHVDNVSDVNKNKGSQCRHDVDSISYSVTFAFVGGPCCPTLDFVIAFWTMISFYALLTRLFCITMSTM